MPDLFEIADVHVALGGDTFNTVPRYEVTAGEIALLQAIHGSDAIHNIVPRGTVVRSQRVERERLKIVYGSARNNDGRLLVEILYPGAAARIFERLDELELVDSQFKSEPVARAGTVRQEERTATQEAAALLVEHSNQNQPALDPEDAANGLDEIEADQADVVGDAGALG